MKAFSITFDVEPVSKQRHRFSRRSGRSYTPAKTRNAELALAEHLGRVDHPFYEKGTPLSVEIVFRMTKPKSVKNRSYPTAKNDLDNMAKLVMDALNGSLWHDDGAVVDLTIRKRYSSHGSIELVVIPLVESKDVGNPMDGDRRYVSDERR